METRPASTRIEFRLGIEQVVAAAYTLVNTIFFTIVIFPSKWSFRAFLSCYLVLFWRQLLSPFFICFGNFVCHIGVPPLPVN